MTDFTANEWQRQIVQLRAQIRELESEVRAHKTEREQLAALRLIVTEKFAGADMYVKPEDAADVAKWAQNPGAVRNLLVRARYTEVTHGGDDESCCDCGAYAEESHSRTQLLDSPGKPWRDCIVAAAWRALADPRGAQDIERAHEEALREQHSRDQHAKWVREEPARRASFDLGARMIAQANAMLAIPSPFRLASESQRAAQARTREEGQLWGDQFAHSASRMVSDARGMEAVEAEARFIDWGFDDATQQARRVMGRTR